MEAAKKKALEDGDFYKQICSQQGETIKSLNNTILGLQTQIQNLSVSQAAPQVQSRSIVPTTTGDFSFNNMTNPQAVYDNAAMIAAQIVANTDLSRYYPTN